MDEFEMQAFEMSRALYEMQQKFPRNAKIETNLKETIDLFRKRSRTYRKPITKRVSMR